MTDVPPADATGPTLRVVSGGMDCAPGLGSGTRSPGRISPKAGPTPQTGASGIFDLLTLDRVLTTAWSRPDGPYAGISQDYITACFAMPIYLGNLQPLLSGDAYFTHLRPDRFIPRGAFPTPEDWNAGGPVMWIGDVVALPSRTGYEVGKALRAAVAFLALAQPGEKVLYWRQNGRIGWFTVR